MRGHSKEVCTCTLEDERERERSVVAMEVWDIFVSSLTRQHTSAAD